RPPSTHCATTTAPSTRHDRLPDRRTALAHRTVRPPAAPRYTAVPRSRWPLASGGAEGRAGREGAETMEPAGAVPWGTGHGRVLLAGSPEGTEVAEPVPDVVQVPVHHDSWP